jgi:LmbE family N-acetylglucosaminyl deacetylase
MTEVIQKVIADLDPAIVYVHSKNDANLDHRAVHDATLIAAANVLTLACYQGNSATVDFQPNRFVTIDSFLEKKLEMIACYSTEGNRPRALQPDFVTATARAWSRYGQGTYCEPLEIMRDSAAVSHAE